jgi:hypothetical protein
MFEPPLEHDPLVATGDTRVTETFNGYLVDDTRRLHTATGTSDDYSEVPVTIGTK